MLDEKKIQEILEGAEDEIRQSLTDEVKRQATDAVGYQLRAQIQKIVEKFVTETVGDEITKQLIDTKPMILKATAIAAKGMGELLAESMIDATKEKLGDSWKRDRIIKAILD